MNRASSLQLDTFFSVKFYILANERSTLLRRRKHILGYGKKPRECCLVDVGIYSRRDIMSETRGEEVGEARISSLRKKVALGKLLLAVRFTRVCNYARIT